LLYLISFVISGGARSYSSISSNVCSCSTGLYSDGRAADLYSAVWNV